MTVGDHSGRFELRRTILDVASLLWLKSYRFLGAKARVFSNCESHEASQLASVVYFLDLDLQFGKDFHALQDFAVRIGVVQGQVANSDPIG